MACCKLSFLLTITIGLIMRANTVNPMLEGILDQYQTGPEPPELFKTYDEPLIELVAQGCNDIKPFENLETSESLKQIIPESPSIVNNFLITFLPAIVALLTKDFLLDYLVSATGFISPLIIVVFPSLAYINLGDQGKLQASSCQKTFVKAYLWLGSSVTYFALIARTLFRAFAH